jgi:transcriptional regulator with XRE-family HTH domain
MKTDTDPTLAPPAKCDRNLGLGQVMRTLRKGAKVTQADIAEAMGLERTSVCNIEGGIQALTIEKLHAFADRVGVEVVVQFRPKKRTKASVVSCALGRPD